MQNNTSPSPADVSIPKRRTLAGGVHAGVARWPRSLAGECAVLWLRVAGIFWRFRTRLARTCSGQAGTSTAEYAIATLAAVAFAGLLVVIMRSDEVRGFLLNIIRTALAIP